MTWSELTKPWQVCLELAWEAYCDDCIPIGAVVTDSGGKILSRGRNRIYPRRTWAHRPAPGWEIAHAELEALQHLDYNGLDQHTCSLYTTTEPCPMCMGAFYMSGARRLLYAARDPFAGSTNLLGSTWYLGRKPVKVSGPDPVLESIVVSLFTEQELAIHEGKFPEGLFWEMHKKALPAGVELGCHLFERGELTTMRKSGASARDMYDRLISLV